MSPRKKKIILLLLGAGLLLLSCCCCGYFMKGPQTIVGTWKSDPWGWLGTWTWEFDDDGNGRARQNLGGGEVITVRFKYTYGRDLPSLDVVPLLFGDVQLAVHYLEITDATTEPKHLERIGLQELLKAGPKRFTVAGSDQRIRIKCVERGVPLAIDRLTRR